MVGEAGDPPANEINGLSEKCGDNALLNGKGNFEPSPHLDILTAPVAMVIQLLDSGQIPHERIPSLLAERPDVAEAWSSEQRGGGGSGWQPIETAPKDGTRIILAWGGRSVVGYYLDNSRTQYPWQGWKVPSLEDHPGGQPTDWQPFPAPPATLTQGAGDER